MTEFNDGGSGFENAISEIFEFDSKHSSSIDDVSQMRDDLADTGSYHR